MMASEGKDCGVKRKRSNNFSAREKGLLVDLVGRYAAIVECKKTDGSTMKEKEQAWMRLADEYNAGAETARDWRALKTVR